MATVINIQCLFYFIFSLTLHLGGADCPNGFVRHDESCYKIFTISTSWPEATIFCEVFGAELAEITSEREQNFITKYLSPDRAKLSQDIWIGGTDVMVEGSFYWAKSEDPVQYTAWAPGEPTDSGLEEDCMALFPYNNFKWNDAPCETKQMFLCEIPGDLYQGGQIVIG